MSKYQEIAKEKNDWYNTLTEEQREKCSKCDQLDNCKHHEKLLLCEE